MRARDLLCLLLLIAGCPSEVPDPPPPPAVDPAAPAPSGEARAAVLPSDPAVFAASTWGGITAEARPGDVKIWNSQARFVVRSAPGHGYVGVPGALIDADLVRPGDELGRDTLEEAFLAFGIGRLAGLDSITVINDGLDGAPAVVRVEGTDVPWQFVMGVIESDEPLTPAMGLRVVTDYILPPDTTALEIRTTLTNTSDEEVRTNPLDGLIASGEDLYSFATGEGLAPGVAEEPMAIGTVGRNGEPALSLFLPDGPLDRFGASDLLAGSGVSLATHGWFDIPPGESAQLVRFRALGRDTLDVEAVRSDQHGEELVSVSGQVTAGGAGVAGARVHFVNDAVDPVHVRGFALTDGDGGWSARVPAGPWTVWVTGRGNDELIPLPGGAHRFAPFAHEGVNARQVAALNGSDPRTPLGVAHGHPTPEATAFVAEEGATLDLTLTPPAVLRVGAVDGAGDALPAMVELVTTDAPTSPVPAELRDALGLPSPSGRILRSWTPGWDVDLPLPAGAYAVTVESGPRRSRHVEEVALVSGEVLTLQPTMTESVARDGWLSMDAHLHAAPSNDGELPMEHRLIACAAAGVDLPVTTDHDRQADYRPLAAALGLDPLMTVLPGVEVSPPLRGHFNLFPIEPAGPGVVNGGAPAWWLGVDDSDALMGLMRESAPDAAIQINHGRDGASGMMNAGAFDPTVAEPFRPDFWSWDFDLFELVNARGVGNWIEPRTDWFSWLNTGRIRVPTGVSDSHGLSAVCGYGRTDVFLDRTDAAEVDPAAVRAALASGHVVVSGGPSLRVEGPGGELPGDTLVGGDVSLAVTVRAADWIVPTEVRLYRNGELLETRPVTDAWADGLWFEETFTDTRTADAWYAVEVQGDQALGAFWGGAVPYAMTNAFFVDVDGDGWTPPGLD